jgi:phage-related protein
MSATDERAEMADSSDARQHVRKVVLPSGKTIEVVYVDQTAATPDTSRDLHHCGTCDSDLVYPVEWEEASATHWKVTLRCPNCEWTGTGVFDQATVDSFDEELDRGLVVLVSDLKRVTQENMELEIESFVRALEADAVLPEDFAVRNSRRTRR